MPRVLDNPNNRSVAAILLREGGVVAFPTDTVYGLAAAAFNYSALSALFVMKGRSRTQGVPVLLAAESQIREVGCDISDAAYALIERFWPGALTLVIPRHPQLPALVSGGGQSVAVRLPDHPCPQALSEAIGGPITGTSANRHGGAEPTTADEVQKQLGNRLSLILDGGPSVAAVPSTIVDTTVNPPRILRSGMITKIELEEVCVIHDIESAGEKE